MIGYSDPWILRDGGDTDFSWIREVFVGTINGFNKKYKGQSPNMELRGDFS